MTIASIPYYMFLGFLVIYYVTTILHCARSEDLTFSAKVILILVLGFVPIVQPLYWFFLGHSRFWKVFSLLFLLLSVDMLRVQTAPPDRPKTSLIRMIGAAISSKNPAHSQHTGGGHTHFLYQEPQMRAIAALSSNGQISQTLRYRTLQFSLPWREVQEKKQVDDVITLAFPNGKQFAIAGGMFTPAAVERMGWSKEISPSRFDYLSAILRVTPSSVPEHPGASSTSTYLTIKEMLMTRDNDRIFEWTNDHGLKGFEFSGGKKGTYRIHVFDLRETSYDLILSGMTRKEVDFILASLQTIAK